MVLSNIQNSTAVAVKFWILVLNKKLFHCGSFWKPKSQYRSEFIWNGWTFFKGSGGSFYVFAGVEIMSISCYMPEMLSNSSWRPWGLLGLLGGSLGCLLVWWLFFIVLAGVQIMTIFCSGLYAQMLQNSFWRPGSFGPSGGSLCSPQWLHRT